jgi:hypothetical protein
MRSTIVLTLAAGLAVAAGVHDAAAKPKHHRAQPYANDGYVELPLTVNQRSFLDPGPVAPVGTGQNYVAANTIFNRTPDRTFNQSQFGNDVIVGQPYVPGRSVPVAEFATGPNPGDLYAGPLFGITP